MLKKSELFNQFSNCVPGENMMMDVEKNSDINILFEPLSMSGLGEMHLYSKDHRLYEFFEFSPFETIEQTQKYIEKLQQRMEDQGEQKSAVYWFIRKKSNRQLIGTAALVSLNYDRQSVEWGYAIDPKLWGCGYIYQIQEILKEFVFENLQLNRLSGTTMLDNKRTISSLIASGMRYEGTMRQYYCKDGVFIDGWHYSMIKNEYLESNKNKKISNHQIATQEVIEIVNGVLKSEKISCESDMCSTPSWDSLNHMEIMIAISKAKNIVLSPNEVMRARSVKSITEILNKNSQIL